jgi:DNA primase catalytic subunit
MLRSTRVYTPQQIALMWESVAYRDCRRFGFFNGRRWFHPEQHFADVHEFGKFIENNHISDVHAKALENDGGREWVIDVDVDAVNEADLQLKIRVATATFLNFFGENVARIMHSGNRGIHVWLRIDRFAMNASKQLREKYYKVFVVPKESDLAELAQGCFAAAYVRAVGEISECRDKPLLSFWPTVDKHVFCNLNQIRVPYSYNYKGKKFSHLLH